MGSIPLPALDIKPPQQPDMMGELSKLMAMKSMMQQQQGQQQEMQLRQQQIADSQATTAAMRKWDGKDYDALAKAVLENGGSANAATSVQQHGLTIKKTVSDIAKQDSETGSKNLETFIGKHKAIGDALEGIESVPDDQLHRKATETVQSLLQGGIMDAPAAQQALAGIQQIQDPKALRKQIDVFAKASLGAKAAAEEEKVKSETAKNNSEKVAADELAGQRRAESQYYQAHGGAPGVPVETVQQNDWLARPENKGKGPADYPGAKAAAVAAAEEPSKIRLATAEAEARQRAAQGDPNVAGKMLADGSLTLADLKTRGTTPQFIEQATLAAQKVNPTYNPADEMIAEHIAKSPGANQFFGSANSLIEKGGTLDQLEDLGKKIPQHDFPVLNTVDDWQKLARGKGPLAGYASIALGVADDYSKVMGGGQGSDTSRDQALHLFAQAASPEMRAQAVAATRGAVLSQRDARIGKNQFLKRQYGMGELGGQAETKTFQGHTYTKQPDGSWKLTQ